MMKRREFITLLGAAAVWPLAARAQQPMPLIGFLSSFTSNPQFIAAFHRGLGEAGYVEGQNVAIEYRWVGEGEYGRLPATVTELVNRQVAVIVASPIPAAVAAKEATQTIPIVFAVGSDPVESGLVSSLNRPGGNITGVGFQSVALGAKRLELLRDLMPKLESIAVLVNPRNPNADPQTTDMQSATAALGVRLDVLTAASKDELAIAFATLARRRSDALVVSADPFFISSRDLLVLLATRHGVPAIYYAREFATAGGLMSYGTNFANAHREAGVYVARILKGEKPGDLPVGLSAKFELVINLNAATALGLTIPPTLLARADEVIE
jgi:putative tryptophan/tyrosine transport system substrate-binding protein